MNKTRVVILVVIVLVVGVNALYDGKIAEFIGNALYQWQTGETAEDRLARDEYRAQLEKQFQGVKACPALEAFAREVDREPVGRRGIRAEVLVDNVKAESNREFVSAYLAAFQKLAYKDSREFDDELQIIVEQYCENEDHTTTRPHDHGTG